MEPFVLTELRHAMGLSISEMADVLGLSGANAADMVRQMERGGQGGRPISGPLRRIMRYLAQATASAKTEGPFALVSQVLPRWLDCVDLENESGAGDILMHTRWPRFFGWVTKDLSDDIIEILEDAEIPIAPMSPGLGLGRMAILFIDQPVGDMRSLIAEAVRLREARVHRNVLGKSQVTGL